MAPQKHENKLIKLFSAAKSYFGDKDIVAIVCTCMIVLNILFIICCFSSCFRFSSDLKSISLSFFDTFIGNTRFNIVLIIILNVLSDIALLSFIIKRNSVSRLILLVPAVTYIWSVSQLIIKTVNVSKVMSETDSSVQFNLTVFGWAMPIVCAISIVLLIYISLKLKKDRE